MCREVRLPAREERQPWFRLTGVEQPLNSLPNEVGFCSAFLVCRPRQLTLKVVRQIDRRPAHAIHYAIHNRRGRCPRAGKVNPEQARVPELA